MSVDSLAAELSQMHVDHIRLLTQLADTLLTKGETGVLLWLNRKEGDIYSTDIVNFFGLTPGRVANIVKRLEEKAYIERKHDDVDMRRARILLTDKGITRARILYDEMNENHLRILKALGETDSEESVRILKRVLSLVENGIELHTSDV